MPALWRATAFSSTLIWHPGGRSTSGRVDDGAQQYLAEEVAEDHVDGIITRREAMRRLGLLGVGAATASAMIAAEALAHGPAARPRARPRPRPRPGDGDARRVGAGRRREPITFAGPERRRCWRPGRRRPKPRGGVLVIHENRGLTEHIRNVAGRFAASGYVALALDLLSEEGGTGAFPGEAEVAAALSAISAEPGRASTPT